MWTMFRVVGIGLWLAGLVFGLTNRASAQPADNSQACEQLPPDHRQQCEQERAAGIANQVIDNVKQGAQDAQQQLQNATDQKTAKPSAGRPMHLLLNGIETCWPIDQPLPAGVKQEPVPGDVTGRC